MKMIRLTKRYCVYVDDTLEPIPRHFYVGKGTENRVNLIERNEVHARITEKYGRIRHVLLETDDEAEALDAEIRMITAYRTYAHGGPGFWGANLTQGGDGTSGRIVTEETRRNLSRGVREAFRRDPSIAARISASQRIMMSDPEHVKRIVLAGLATRKSWSSEKRRAITQALSERMRGRISPVRGSKSPRTIFSDCDVRDIKHEFMCIMKHGVESGVRGSFSMTCEAIARRYQVTYKTIYKIVRGATWAHIQEEYQGDVI